MFEKLKSFCDSFLQISSAKPASFWFASNILLSISVASLKIGFKAVDSLTSSCFLAKTLIVPIPKLYSEPATEAVIGAVTS